MFEFLLGLFITAMLNGIWATRGDPERHPRYWSKEETTSTWHEMDSTLFERVYEFDSVVYFYGDAAVIRNKPRTDISDSTISMSDTLHLDGL